MISIREIAAICHEANRAYCLSLGDKSQKHWEDAPSWQQESAVMGVGLHLSGDLGPAQSHESWMREKEKNGWVYGKTKDEQCKTHPCLVPFDQLSREQQLKDVLFRQIVHAFKNGDF